MDERRRRVLYDKKWFILLKRTWLFRYIPFIDFALGAGSMAVGNVDEESDFDVLIGARQRRIFTARFFAVLAFGLFGWRRKKTDTGAGASNKVCLNHFITPASYRFTLDINPYWEQMYQGLVPVFGDERAIRVFLEENKELIPEPKHVVNDLRFRHHTSSFFKKTIERLLSGAFGDFIERKLKAMQVARINAEAPSRGSAGRTVTIPGAHAGRFELAPLIRCSDTELQFHPDPITIEISSS